MNKLILLAFCLLSTNALGMDSTVPKKLTEAARKNQCEQIDNFHDLVDVAGASFVYGVVQKEGVADTKSAAFWCRDVKNRDVFLLRLFVDASIRSLNQCPLLIDKVTSEIGTLGMGELRVEYGNWELDKFTSLNDKKKGSGLYKGQAIISEADAYEVVYICYKKKWMRKILD